MRKSQNLTPPISQCQHQPGTFIRFFFSFYHKNCAFLIDTFESKNNWYLSGYKYLAEFLFYVLLIVFKSSQKQFRFFSLQDFSKNQKIFLRQMAFLKSGITPRGKISQKLHLFCPEFRENPTHEQFHCNQKS